MIGELINKFDSMEDNSFKAFKSLFKTSLDYPSDSIVTIGKVLTGDFRELIIGTEHLRGDLKPLEKGLKKVDTTLTYIVSDSEGNELYKAVGTKELKKLSNRGLGTMYKYETSREGSDVYMTIPKDEQLIYRIHDTKGVFLFKAVGRRELTEKTGKAYSVIRRGIYKRRLNNVYIKYQNMPRTYVIVDDNEKELFRSASKTEIAAKSGRSFKTMYLQMYKKEDNLVFIRMPKTTKKRK